MRPPVSGDNQEMDPTPENQPIPPYIEELYEFLKKEIWLLHSRWITFAQLYRKGDLRLELLNEVGSSFFHMLQWLLYDDLQLGLAKLTDDRHDTASLVQLQRRLDKHADSQLAKRAGAVLQRLVGSVDAIRKQRDNVIAHYALDQATNAHAEKLPDVYYTEIVAALELVREYMNLIELHYHPPFTQGYEHFISEDDGDTLVTVLRWGIRHRDWMMAQSVFIEPKDKWTGA